MSQETLQSYVGGVDAIEEPQGNGPYNIVLGVDSGQFRNTKKFKCWPTDYETKQANPNLTVLQAAHASGDQVQVGFTTKRRTYNGKTFPENTIHEVSVVGGAPSSSPTDGSGWAAPAVSSSPATPPSGAAAPSNIDPKVASIANTLRACADELEGK